MNLRDLKSLNSTISEVAKPETQDKSRMIQEGFGNSLSAKARQVVAEQVEGSRGPNPKVPVKKVKDATGSVGIEAERIKRDGQAEMKRMMAKALKRAKKKARLVKEEEEIELAEVAAPGYEDWASNPKVKARFKERYGKRWKQVMYGHSWNMKEAADAEAELDLAESVSAKRMRIIRKYVKGNKRVPAHLKDYMERSFKKKRVKDAKLSDGRGAVGALETRMRRKSAALRARGVEPKGVAPGYLEEGAKGNKVFESTQLDELSKKTMDSYVAKRGSQLQRMTTGLDRYRNLLTGKKQANAVKGIKRAMGVKEETEQLDEAGYKRLMRIKKAAYKADLASRNINPKTPKQDIELNRLVNRHGKLGRAAAEREAQVAAGMARRGGASPDAVRGGGSRIGKSGKYTQKAGALANQRDKALGKFRGRASGSKSREAVQTPFGMYNKNAATKRKMQKAQAAFEKKARTGDFDISPSAKMHQMFARLNFQKKYGRLKGK